DDADGKAGFVLIEIRPVIGGDTGRLCRDAGVVSDESGQSRFRHGLFDPLARATNEEAPAGVVVSGVSLKLNWVFAEGLFHQSIETANHPRIVHLELHREEAIRL